MFRMIVFDMAGTAISEGNIVYKTLHACINQGGFDIDLDAVLRIGAGKEKWKAIDDIVAYIRGYRSKSITDSLYSNFRDDLGAAYEHATVVPMPGMAELIRFLRQHNIRIALNTGYDHPTAKLLLNKIGWKLNTHYDDLITSSHVDHGRPAPDMINLACTHAEINDKTYVAKIGDSRIDIEEGKNAGCGLVVGITTGAQTRELLDKGEPDLIVDSMKQFHEYLEKQLDAFSEF
ncbi:MAG: HAD-IA family hydrolase [Saprospiraceae bacterium]|nr:HAD-IA family hydrolase [Saprospiraceae bacterium]